MQPSTFDTYSSIFSNLATGITAIVLVVVAIQGLRSWRHQMVGQNRYTSARQLLLLARRFRAAFARSRSPFGWSNEYIGRERLQNESPYQSRVLDEQYARVNRLRPAADILSELEQAAWEAEIVTGEELIQIVQPFADVVRELNIAINQMFGSQLQAANSPDTSPLWEIVKEFDQTELIYQPGEDELNERVNEALRTLERKLKKYIK